MKRMNLLVVDDDLEDQELFNQALQETDVFVQAEFSNNGAEALCKLQACNDLPDVIFCDINMPMMNGIQFLETIKKTEKLNTIPVVMFTTSSNVAYRSQCEALGAIYFITKPSSFSKMCEEIRNVFSQFFKPKMLRSCLTGFVPLILFGK